MSAFSVRNGAGVWNLGVVGHTYVMRVFRVTAGVEREGAGFLGQLRCNVRRAGYGSTYDSGAYSGFCVGFRSWSGSTKFTVVWNCDVSVSLMRRWILELV